MTPTFVEQVLNQFNDDAILVLVKIEHPSIDTLRVVSSNLPVTSQGQEYLAFPCSITLPSDADSAPSATLTISNVSSSIGEGLELLVGPAIITFSIVLASDPDVVEREWPQMQLIDATWNNISVRANLSQEVYWNEPWPKKRITPLGFPGMFA